MTQSAGAPIKRWELIELTVPASSQGKVTFQTIAQLRNQENQLIVIKDIEIFPITSYANSQKTPSLPGMPVADIPKAVLVLYINGEESVHYVPVAKLIHVNDATNPFSQNWPGFDDLSNVDFDQSYLQFATASDAADYIVPFGITYLRYMKDPNNPNQMIAK